MSAFRVEILPPVGGKERVKFFASANLVFPTIRSRWNRHSGGIRHSFPVPLVDCRHSDAAFGPIPLCTGSRWLLLQGRPVEAASPTASTAAGLHTRLRSCPSSWNIIDLRSLSHSFCCVARPVQP